MAPSDMVIEEIDSDDDAAMASWHSPFAAADSVAWPGEPGWTAGELTALVRQRTMAHSAVAVAREPYGVSGSLWVRMPIRESREVADLSVVVHPSRRGLGLGRALLAHGEEVARQAGRTKAVGQTDEPIEMSRDSRNTRFARAAGYEAALAEARRALRLPVDPDHLDELEASSLPHGDGYGIRVWTGPCPPELLAGRAALARSISTDAPQGSLEKDEEDWDPDRIREAERTVEQMGREAYSAGAVDRDGSLVGFSQIGVPRSVPQVGYQFDTVVLPQSRGHRLGLLLKIANLRQLARSSPAAERVLTWNAASNGPMIGVNDALGFELVGLGTLWKKELA